MTREQRPEAKRRRFRPAVLLLSACFVATLFFCGQQLAKLHELRQKQAYYETVYQGLVAENTELLATQALLGDEVYMERLARERFKLIKPNEYLVIPAETNEDLLEQVEVKDSDLH